ncbi:MAG: divergent PAP2 family protein, partial [Ruminiclostridium sp.]|nr:divergent PAP2 family protein [Ruminiclostridium sp.]
RRVVNELDEEYMDRFDDCVDEYADNNAEETADLKEFLGHTPLEVLCGALLGILVAMATPIIVV